MYGSLYIILRTFFIGIKRHLLHPLQYNFQSLFFETQYFQTYTPNIN